MSLEGQHNDFEIFRKYYTGKMSADEKAIFEKNLENDPFAQEAYEGFLELDDDFKRISFIEKTNMNLKEKVGLETASAFPIKTALGIAASVVLLIGSVFVIQNSFNNKEGEIAKNEVKTTAIEQMEIIEEEVSHTDTSQFMYSDSAIDETMQPEQDGVIVEDVPAPKEERIESSAKEKTKYTPPTPVNDKKQIDYEDYYNNQDESLSEEAEIVEQERSMQPNVSAQYNSLEYKDDNKVSSAQSDKLISNYNAGIVAYNQSNYSEAIQLFNKALNERTNVNSANYYVGMSYFNLGKSNKAINSFDKVIKTSSSFADDAQWYKALSLINKGQKEKAKTVLQDLIQSGSSFSGAAQKKLEKL